MKNLHQYLQNSLNEVETSEEAIKLTKLKSDNKKGIGEIQTTDPDEVEEWIETNYKKLKIVDDKLHFIGKADYVLNSKDKIDLLKLYKQVQKNKNKNKEKLDNITVYNEEHFIKLGKAVGYRSATLMMSAQTIQDIAKEVVEDDDEYSIKQVEDIEDLFNYAAAVKIANNLTKKEENKNEAKELASKLTNDVTRLDTINDIKEKYSKDFSKYYDLYKNAYDKGLKEIREKMAKPDFEWKDPITNLPPKGFKGKSSKIIAQTFQKIGDIGSKFESKIPAQHNLENDMARLACFGVKALFKGIGAIKSLLGGIKSNYRKEQSKTKINQIQDKIKEYNKEFNSYLKNKSKETTENNESLTFMGKIITEDTNQNNEQKRKEILQKFNDLWYSTIIPYICYKQSNITYSFENKDNLYLLKEENGKWNTLNSAKGNISYIDDNRQLLLNLYKILTKDLQKSLLEFKDEKLNTISKAIPDDLKYQDKNSVEFTKWINNIKLSDEIGQDQISGFKNILKLYNSNFILTKAQYENKTFNNLVKYLNDNIKTLESSGSEPVLKDIEIEFNDDIQISIKGIISEKENASTEEENVETPEEIKKDAVTTGKMIAALSDKMKDPNFMELINKTEEQIKKNEDEILDWLVEHPEKEKLYDEAQNKLADINKQIVPRMWLNTYILRMKDANEVWHCKRMLSLLNEADEQTNVDYEELSKMALNLLDDSLENLYKAESAEKFKQIYDEWIKNINTTIEKIVKIGNEEVNKQLETYKDKDPLEKAAAIAKAIDVLSNKKDDNTTTDETDNKENEESTESAESEETK